MEVDMEPEICFEIFDLDILPDSPQKLGVANVDLLSVSGRLSDRRPSTAMSIITYTPGSTPECGSFEDNMTDYLLTASGLLLKEQELESPPENRAIPRRPSTSMSEISYTPSPPGTPEKSNNRRASSAVKREEKLTVTNCYRRHSTTPESGIKNNFHKLDKNRKSKLPKIAHHFAKGLKSSKTSVEVLEKEKTDQDYYPNCDVNVWLRSCEKEVIEPLQGVTTGTIPSWLNGSLLRNGPGSLKVGEMSFKHLFDSAALLHRFEIKNGNVTYQCRFLQSETYKKNMAAQRIVVSEFGTSSVPDPCQSIFQRVAAVFDPVSDMQSDNAMISIYPYGDELFALTEYPVIHKINPVTLETERRVNLTEYTGIINHTSHPHVMADGTVYNLGQTISKTGPVYTILCFPHGERMFEDAHIVGTVPVRWRFHPGYMHTFGITENFFVIVEQPLSVSVPAMVKAHLTNQPFAPCLKWYEDQPTLIHLLDRKTGNLAYTFQAEAFFYLHIINQYEKDGHVVLDICCYQDPAMINCMYVEHMKNAQRNPDYANLFRGRPLRFVLPLNKPKPVATLKYSLSVQNLFGKTKKNLSLDFETICRDKKPLEKSKSCANLLKSKRILSTNLVTLADSKAEAHQRPDGSIFCKPELLCNWGCETPRLYYERYLGQEYRYFYAISSDVDAANPGTMVKVDVVNKTMVSWCEKNCYPSEPIFVANPDAKSEDDGVILSAMVWGGDEENRVGLLVLNAKTMTELGRCEFRTFGPVPKCLHGWYAAGK